MNVFVIGTASWFWCDSKELERFEHFKKACKNIGDWLSNKHHVIIAGTVEPTADHWIIEGVQENFKKKGEKGKPNIMLYAAVNDESHQQKNNPLLEWLKSQESVSVSDNYTAAHNRALDQCDIVIAIGGKGEIQHTTTEHSIQGDNVEAVCELAMQRRKPVIGLSYYGSHGRKINDKTTWLYKYAGGVPEDKLNILNNLLDNPRDEEPFLKLLELILEKNPLKKRRWITFCIVLTLILIFLWSLAFFGIPKELEGSDLHKIIVCTTLVASTTAGAFGGILRFLINKVFHLEPEEYLGADIGLGLTVGFVCGLSVEVFGSWLVADIDQSHIDMIQRTALLSTAISILLTVCGRKAILKLKDLFGDLVSRPSP